MDLKDRIFIPLLILLDLGMNLVTLGLWSRLQGEKSVEYKLKVEVE